MKLSSVCRSRRNKKGDMPSLIISMIVILFILAVAALVFSKAFSLTIDELKTKEMFSNRSKETMGTVEEKSSGFLDYMIFFFIVGSLIGLIVSSLFVDAHPAIMIVFVIVLIIAIVLAGVVANAFSDIAEQEILSDKYSEFKLTRGVIDILPLLVFVAGLIVIIVLYGKARAGGGV